MTLSKKFAALAEKMCSHPNAYECAFNGRINTYVCPDCGAAQGIEYDYDAAYPKRLQYGWVSHLPAKRSNSP